MDKWSEYLEKQTELFNKGIIDEKQYNAAIKDANAGMKNHAAALQASAKQLGNSVLDLGSSLVKGASGASVYNDTITSSADVISDLLSKIPFVGKLLGMAVKGAAKFVTAVNEQADALHNAYQDISRSGLVTGMDGIFKDLHSMGYTMKEIGNMGALLKENSTTLATLGGTAAQGAKRLSGISKDIMYSNVGYQLKLMGMSVDDINRGAIQYLKLQQSLGISSNQTTASLAQAATEFIEQQDRLTKITGLNAQEQNKILERAYNDERYNAKQKQLNAQGDQGKAIAKRNDAFLQILQAKGDEKLSSMFQAWTSGALNSEDARAFETALPRTAKALREGVTDIGVLSDMAADDAKRTSDAYGDQGQAGMANKRIGSLSGLYKLSGANLRQSGKDADKTAKEQQDKQKKGQDPATKAMVDLTTAQRNQTMSFEKLANEALPTVTSGVKGFTSALEYANDKVLAPLADKKESIPTGTSATHPAGPSTAPTTTVGTGPNEKGVKGDVLSKKAQLESLIGKKLIVTSGFRAGAANHGSGDAIDLGFGSNKLTALDRNKILKGAVDLGFTGIGAEYRAPGGAHIHLDTSHSSLVGWGSDYTSKSLMSDSPYLAALIDAKRSGKQPPPMPTADNGNILMGPTSGYKAMLHGNEAVIPLPDDDVIPVESDAFSEEELMLMSKKIMLLDRITDGMKQYNRMYENIIYVQT